jgi:hypothetical protein
MAEEAVLNKALKKAAKLFHLSYGTPFQKQRCCRLCQKKA